MKVIAIAAASLIAATMVFAPFEPYAKQQIARAARALTRDMEAGLPPFVATAINEAMHQMGVPGFARYGCTALLTMRRSNSVTPRALRYGCLEAADEPIDI